MNENLLLTKLSKPSFRPDHVRRSRLSASLDAGLSTKLTLISAPAGFGKTTLVSHWISDTNHVVAWVSLDPEDNQPSRFLSYIYTALQNAYPDFTFHSLPNPDHLDPDDVGKVATLLINELLSITTQVVLVLDDYQVVSHLGIQAYCRYLIEHLPANAHCFILTRIDPPFPLSRWRGRGEMQEIRSFDLRFTHDEILRFMGQIAGISLTEEHLSIIAERTEGWVTGLVLTALSLRKQEDVNRFIQSLSGSHEYIADYLTDEVLLEQPEDVQSFLLQTSILRYLSADLCNAILKNEDSQSLLEKLERENLFITSLDETRQWYRYHQLFIDLLQKRLFQLLPDSISRLYDAASRWHEDHGFIQDAIYYASAGKHNHRVVSLIEKYVLDIILQGEFYQAQNWLDMLPGKDILARPVLCVAKAWIAIRNTDLKQVYELIDRAEHLSYHLRCETQIDKVLIDGYIATLKAIAARAEGKSPYVQQSLIQKAFAIIPEHNDALKSMLNMRLGLSYLDLGNEQEADRLFEEIITVEHATRNHYTLYGAVYIRTVIAYLQGRLHDVETMCEETLRHSASTMHSPWQRVAVHGFAYIALGIVQLEWNEIASAADSLKRGLSLNTASGLIEVQIKGEYALGRLMLAKREQPQTLDLHRLKDGVLPELTSFAQALQAHLWLMTFNQGGRKDNRLLERLLAWINMQSLGPIEGYDRDWQIKRQLIAIRVWLTLDDMMIKPQDAPDQSTIVSVLDELNDTYIAHGWIDRVIEILIVKAMTLNAMKRPQMTRETLVSAIKHAELSGYVRIFLDEGDLIIPLLYRCAADDGEAAKHAGYLLDQYNHLSSPQALSKLNDNNMVIPLTPRELEILTLIADGLTNQEIGQALSISLGTVKRHTANINTKLNAHTRTQAVAIARSFHILE